LVKVILKFDHEAVVLTATYWSRTCGCKNSFRHWGSILNCVYANSLHIYLVNKLMGLISIGSIHKKIQRDEFMQKVQIFPSSS